MTRRWPAVVGVDEVGRGAWAGPVFVCAVWFDPASVSPSLLAALDDSKRLTPRQRDAADRLIRIGADWALGAASASRVDAEGLNAATDAAMARAVARLGRRGCEVVVDGKRSPVGLKARPVVGGDATVPQIAAASIIAKVARDRLMARLAARWSDYGWDTNVGYGVSAHRRGLAAAGVTPHHRLSYRPMAAFLDA